jgi:hypothetical protein
MCTKQKNLRRSRDSPTWVRLSSLFLFPVPSSQSSFSLYSGNATRCDRPEYSSQVRRGCHPQRSYVLLYFAAIRLTHPMFTGRVVRGLGPYQRIPRDATLVQDANDLLNELDDRSSLARRSARRARTALTQRSHPSNTTIFPGELDDERPQAVPYVDDLIAQASEPMPSAVTIASLSAPQAVASPAVSMVESDLSTPELISMITCVICTNEFKNICV